MKKYDPLKKYLLESNKSELTLTYKEIEEIINEKLPPSAYKYQSFWCKGKTHVWMIAINEAGYSLYKSNIKEGYIELKKTNIW